MDKVTSKLELDSLIEKYEKVIVEKKSSKYNEEMTKKDFILPLFRILGWDVEDSNEVTAEERVSKKRVDYGFRINGIPKFFLEAKSLGENLDTPKFVEQAINYAWHKGCTWAVLTNFDCVRIFNAEWKAASYLQSHFKTVFWGEFVDRFDDLWLLSKEGFEQNSLNKLAEIWGKKSKKTSIDKQLLEDFTRFRTILSKNIIKLNQGRKLTEEELDESVQRILDRLIFIRNCEDRELEEKTLISHLRDWESEGTGQLVKSLREVFSYFDKEYNSKIFARRLADELDIEDYVLREVIEGLYYTPDRSISYDFSAIDADVLGNIYEQYLSHILKKTEKRATLTENNVHRKEQGIYYTPTYIVEYIVKSTLGELLAQKDVTPEKIRILDPACGSGSFLIKAFDVLNENRLKNDEDYSQAKLDFDTNSIFSTRVEILRSSIFGVDLDRQAVEIAQLNLLLKIAEKRHRLPLLEQNIKCGDSLIDDEKVVGDKAFNWEKEFKEVMGKGGFDVVIGNPPYVRQEELRQIKPFLETKYKTYQSMADLFVYFFELGLNVLKSNGYYGIIVSNKWLKAGYGGSLRKFLGKYWLDQFIDFGDLKVFQDATTYPCIIIMRKMEKHNPRIKVCQVETLDFDRLDNYVKKNQFYVDQRNLDEKGWNFKKVATLNLLGKIRNSTIPLKDYVSGEVYRGILTGFSEAFIIDEKKKKELIEQDPKSIEIIHPFLKGNEVRRYRIDFQNRYIILTKIGTPINEYPAILDWLTNFKSILEKRWDKGDHWYELRACDYYELFEKPKIVYGVITVGPRFSLDTEGYYANNANFFIPTADKKLLAILNSKLGWFLIANTCTEIRGGYQLIWRYFGNIPISRTSSPELESLSDRMLSLNEKLISLKNKPTDEKKRIEEEISQTDAEIDELVYELYELTEREKGIIEESLK